MSSTPAPVALVTGATRGIGQAVAEQLAAARYHVVVAGRDRDRAEATAAALRERGWSADAVMLDLDDPRSIDAAAAQLGDRSLDLLVNNAAAFADWSETATSADLDRARSVVDTNLFGTWTVIQAMLPALRRAEGARIVNVGSGGGTHADPAHGLAAHPSAASYAVSKAALHALTTKLATELAPEGIDVVAADPGLTATAEGMETMGARPVADGARSIVTAALDTALAPNGSLTRDGQPLGW